MNNEMRPASHVNEMREEMIQVMNEIGQSDYFVPTIVPGTTGNDIVAQIEQIWYRDDSPSVKLGRFVLRPDSTVEIYDRSEDTSRVPTTQPVKLVQLQSVRQFVGRWMYDY